MSYYKQQYSGGPIMENDYITAAVVFIGIISAIVGNIQHRNELAKKRAKILDRDKSTMKPWRRT